MITGRPNHRTGGPARSVREIVVVIVATFLATIQVTTGPATDTSGSAEAATFVVAAVAGVALLWRRRRPWLVAVIGIIASALYALLAGPILPVLGWLAIFVISRHIPELATAVRGAAAAAAAVILGTLAGALVHDRTSALPLVASLTTVVLLTAVLIRLQLARIEANRRQQQAERERAVVGERLRIARDLHDLVGHGLSVVAVQSSAARVALDAGDAAATRRALTAAEQASRAAMVEMRQMLGILRSGEADPGPSPGLAQIQALVADARAAGLQVTVEESGPVETVPPAADLTAYRVVQEALTNAVRYAPGAPVTITIDADQDRLAISVTDAGTGSPPRELRPSYGLLGLQERVVAAGGTLQAGPRSDGAGWRLTVWLPLRKDERP